MTEPRSWQSETARLGNADPSDPTGWFERLWASAQDGDVTMPWDRGDPHPALASWAGSPGPGAAHGTAVVVGCGLGADAEHLARLGYETTAFDISPTAVAAARARNPGSAVTYAVGDLLDLPREWTKAFDLVVEIYTVQAVNRSVRAELTAGVRSLVAPGGTLLVVQAVADKPDDDGPPWPLTRPEIEAFGQDGLTAVSTEELAVPGVPGGRGLWRAEFRQARLADPPLAELQGLLNADREHTTARIGALTGNVTSIVEATRFTVTDDEHDPEGATIAFERSQASALLAAATEHLAEVDGALQRMVDGTFGRCAVCGAPIPRERLLARPTARTCIACAT